MHAMYKYMSEPTGEKNGVKQHIKIKIGDGRQQLVKSRETRNYGYYAFINFEIIITYLHLAQNFWQVYLLNNVGL